MVRMVKEIETFEELKNFCWGGAEDVLKRVEEKGLQDDLMNLLNDLSCETPFKSETQVNDFIWFDLENETEVFNNLWED